MRDFALGACSSGRLMKPTTSAPPAGVDSDFVTLDPTEKRSRSPWMPGRWSIPDVIRTYCLGMFGLLSGCPSRARGELSEHEAEGARACACFVWPTGWTLARTDPA